MTFDRLQAVEQICQQYSAIALYVFGSRAHEARQWLDGLMVDLRGSGDVDVGVRAAPGRIWSVKDKVRLALALENMMGCERIDLVVLQEADPFLAVEIIRGERLYTRDEYEADEYDLYVLRRAGDLEPLERERQALILGETE
jgi:predicted nucleotidyltransferase